MQKMTKDKICFNKLDCKYSLCLFTTRAFYYKQVIFTSSFKSIPANFKIRHAINLLECDVCKIQNVNKCENPFNIPQNNYEKDVKYFSFYTERFPLPEHYFNNNFYPYCLSLFQC